jgi:carboxymethylenebutenolidase
MYVSETLHVMGNDMQVLHFSPSTPGPHPALIVAQHFPLAHEGLEKDPFQLVTGERYANAGFVCAMPYFFHWWPSDEDAQVKRGAFRDDWTVADLKVTFEWLSHVDNVDSKRIGVLGHCFGGRIAWLGACHISELQACGIFYGGRIKDQFADGAPAPIALAGSIECPVLGIFGNEDQTPTPEDVDDYEKALITNHRTAEFHRYDGAGHGFQDFTNSERYREKQSEDAWEKAISFFRRHLSE